MENMENLQNLDLKSKGKTTPLDAGAMPGFLPAGKNSGSLDLTKFRIRYQKINMDEPADVAELERIETISIHNGGNYVWSKKEFIFMDKIFILIQYLEEVKE